MTNGQLHILRSDLKINNLEIKNVLKKHGVQNLYHCNTVETSLSFIKNGGLLSREFCEKSKLPQTPQKTDLSDKKYNIYNDIFFDASEIQKKTGISYYGPVLFVYDVNVLDTIEGDIYITKCNPITWHNILESERCFETLKDLSDNFCEEDFGQHIVLKNQKKPLSFKYLVKIVLSNPQKDDNSIFEIARKTIAEEIKFNKINVPIEIRDCKHIKRFSDTYRDFTELEKHFGLGGHEC